MKKIKALLFDMDGVLIDAKDWHFQAFLKALAQFGVKISEAEHKEKFDGLPTKEKLKILTQKNLLPQTAHEQIYRLKQKYTREMIETNCHPDPRLVQTIKSFKNEGYKLAVASNSIRDSVHLMLKKAELFSLFDLILSRDDVAEGKPSPEIYEKCMKHFGLKPEDCLVIEDNPHGITAAQAARIENIFVVQSTKDVTEENIRKFL